MKMNIVIIIWPWYEVGVAVLDLSRTESVVLSDKEMCGV